MDSQDGLNPTTDVQNQMALKFAQESGMNIEYSKRYVHSFIHSFVLQALRSRRCLIENNWLYEKAAQVFVDLQKTVAFVVTYSPIIRSVVSLQNSIPPEAFKPL